MPDTDQPKFSDAALDEYRQLLGRYPTRQAALLPTLWIAQREFGWLSDATQDYVAHLMELPPAHVRAVVSFYTMFHRKPVGRYLLDVCTNVTCRLRGADKIVDCIRRKLKIDLGETTPDGKFTLSLGRMPGVVRDRADAPAEPGRLRRKSDRGNHSQTDHELAARDN